MSALFLCSEFSTASSGLFYEKYEGGKEKNLIFIHGTPGSHKGFNKYLKNEKLREEFNMVSVDRLGFGESGKKAETSFQKQTEAILKVIEKEFRNEKVTCVGHSYGSPLCLKLSIDHPDFVDSTVLIAGAFNPHRKIIRWYNKVATFGPIGWLLSRGLLNSNKEMYGLKKELIKLEKTLANSKSRTLIVHGKKDAIVPFEDSLWLKDKLQGKEVEFLGLKDAGHFVLWKRDEFIADEIIKRLL